MTNIIESINFASFKKQLRPLIPPPYTMEGGVNKQVIRVKPAHWWSSTPDLISIWVDRQALHIKKEEACTEAQWNELFPTIRTLANLVDLAELFVSLLESHGPSLSTAPP